MRFLLILSLLTLAECSNDIGQQLDIKTPQTTCEKKPLPRIGMTQEQVRASCWGPPQGIMESDTARGKEAVLTYPQGNIYMSNGIVTKIESAE